MLITLSNGMLAEVDAIDYDYLNCYSWRFSSWGYAETWIGYKIISMHILVAQRMNLDCSNEIDHKDRNKLNNKRENLRPCTKSQAMANRDKWGNFTSNYKGVTWDSGCRCWRAQIKYKGRIIYLGRFDDELKAAKKYNEWAKKYFGEYACLNQLPDE